MNDRKALKAFKKIKKYCINTPCDLCIFNMNHIYNLDHKNYCYFFEAHNPCSWDVLRFESKELDKRDQEIWGGEGD